MQDQHAPEKPLVSRLLDKAGIDRAYPLVRNIAPGVTLERWNRFARPQISARSAKWPRGLMTVQNAAGYILGLFGFEVRDDLHQSRTLCIRNIIVPNVPGRDTIWASLVDAAETLAGTNRCQGIRAELADDLDPSDTDRAWIVSRVEKSGYVLDGIRAFKRVPDAAAGPGISSPGGGAGGGMGGGRTRGPAGP